MHGCLNRIAPVAADYIEVWPGGLDRFGRPGGMLTVLLASPSPIPTNDFNHIIGVCASKDAAGGASMGFTCELRQGTVPQLALGGGTIIAAFVCANLPSTVGTYYRYRLTTAEAAQITLYRLLGLRFVATNARGGAPRTCRLHWAGVELPTAADPSNAHTRLTPEEWRRKERGLAITQESDRQPTPTTARPF